MPIIKSNADLRNNYNEISTVMSIEAHDEITSRFELYGLMKEGMDDIAEGNTRPFSEAMSSIRDKRKR